MAPGPICCKVAIDLSGDLSYWDLGGRDEALAAVKRFHLDPAHCLVVNISIGQKGQEKAWS
jgi:hypothetical protein